jgi:Xaa-Pro aminopeptidase
MDREHNGQNRRISILQSNLSQAEVDVAILNYSKTIFYYAGTSQPAYLIVTPGDYHLLVQRGMEHVSEESFLPETRISEDGRNLVAVADFLKNRNWMGKRIGIEMDVTPASRYVRMTALLPGHEIVDITKLIMSQRQIKDSEEIETIRTACRMLHEGHKRTLTVLHEGMTELELSAEIEDAHRRAGHEGQWFSRQFDARMGRGALASGENLSRIAGNVLTVTGAGLSKALPLGASRRIIRNGDIIVIDIPTITNGYHCDQSRTYVLGRASEECRTLYGDLKKIADTLISWVKPGVQCSEIYRKAIDISGELGLERHFMYLGSSSDRVPLVGHGVGLEINEPPILGKKSKDVIEADMVVALELVMFRSSREILKIEDTIRIHPGGNEILTITPRKLHEI